MINGKRVAVVLPAYNAAKTIEKTVRELPDAVDIRILVDDGSSDETVQVAEKLGLQIFIHEKNYGYGRNQQTCYREALAAGAEIVVMDCVQCLRCGAGFPNCRRRGTQGRNATVQVCSQPLPYSVSKLVHGRKVVGIPHRFSSLWSRCLTKSATP
jgi:cellulose synthase/poly-beta-1,6-N-acetylglucosamine synthase-like glycosyltransferase